MEIRVPVHSNDEKSTDYLLTTQNNLLRGFHRRVACHSDVHIEFENSSMGNVFCPIEYNYMLLIAAGV